MIDYKRWVPLPCEPIKVFLVNGSIRQAIRYPNGSFYFTDCNHPNQNCYLPESYILKWEYINPELMNELEFIENLYQKEIDRKESEKVLLKYISKISFYERMKILFVQILEEIRK